MGSRPGPRPSPRRRAAGGGRASNLRRLSQQHEAPPGRAPCGHPHRTQERARCGNVAAPQRPRRPHPGRTNGALAARSRDRGPGKESAQHQTPLATVRGPPPQATSRHPHGAQHPAGHARQSGNRPMGLPARHAGSRPRPPASSAGSRERMRALTQSPLTTARGAIPRDALRPPQRCVTPAHKSTHCEAGGGSPRPHHLRIRDGEPPGAGERLSPGAPHNGGESPPREATSPHNTHHRAQAWATRPGCRPTNGRPGEGECLTPDAPQNGESRGSPRAHHSSS